MKNYLLSIFCVCIALTLQSFSLNGQTTITGIVTDQETHEPLAGATIVIEGAFTGVITDKYGRFQLTSSIDLPWLIHVSYTGFKDQEMEITNVSGQVTIQLVPGVLLGEDIIITASRKAEKATDSPASISVISSEKIETQAKSGEPLELIKSVNGIQLNQQGINRSNMTLRGASGVNQTTAQLLKDYRPLVSPGDYYLATARSTISEIDIDRIEVIRGPSGALYGPGVSAGVVHFISKDPFRYPGTTVSISGGERSYFKTNIRHAGHNEAETIGYKVTAGYNSGNDWVLNQEDAAAEDGGLSFGDYFITENGEQVDIPGNLIKDFHSFFIEGTLDYRPTNDLSLVWVSSVAENKGNDRITPGDLFRYWRVWNNQARVRFKNLFAAVNYQVTPATDGTLGSPGWTGQYAEMPGGASFLYTDGDQYYLDAQLQYGFEVPSILTEFTVGGDYKLSIMDGNFRNAGRFHEDDDYAIYGGYLQSKTRLVEDKLDMIFAARLDGFSAFDETGFSPRIGLVYKPDQTSQIRASYNRSYTPSGQVRAFIDFTLATTSWGKIQVLGSHAPITFNNPVTDFFPPFLPDGFAGIGSGLNPFYAFLSNGPVAGAGLPPDLLTYLQSQSVTGSTSGAMNVFLPGGAIGPAVSDIRQLETDPAQLTITQAYELGYKGVLGEKFSASLDFYYMKLKDFESNALGVTPFVSLPNLGDDLRNAILAELDAEEIAGMGGDINQIANLYANIASQAFAGPVGAVQTDQAQEVDGTQVNFGFQSIGNLSYWGADLGLEYYLQPVLSVYLNYGYISQNVFSPGDIGEISDGFNLNTPKNKVRVGLNYLPVSGFFGGIHYLNDQEFMSTNGVYSGIAESRSLVDLSVGYNFGNGLNVSANASNLFDNRYQAFPRLPEIGRLVLINCSYTF